MLYSYDNSCMYMIKKLDATLGGSGGILTYFSLPCVIVDTVNVYVHANVIDYRKK